MDDGRVIAERAAVPTDGTLLFTVAGEDRRLEAIALDRGDEVVAFENYCQHWRDVRLDDGDGATLRNGEVVCEKHGAYFEGDSGYCNYGPCEGAYLPEIEVAVVDGSVYLADDRYSAPRRGPAADGSSPGDDGPGADGSGNDGPGNNRIGFSGN